MDLRNFTNEQGMCPRCNSFNLDYESARFEYNMVTFPWQCKDCGLDGEEWHEMNFVGHNVIDENGNNTDLNETVPFVGCFQPKII